MDVQQASLEDWMRASGIAPQFTIARIGPGPHPDSQLADEPDIQHLELRFSAQSSVETDEVARFQTVLTEYEAAHAATLPERIFYEFTQRFHLPRRQACVDFHVMETEYSVFVDPKGAELIVTKVESRGIPKHFSVSIPANVPIRAASSKEQFRLTPQHTRVWSPKDVREYLNTTLHDYFFDANQRMGLGKPEIIAEADDADPGYLDLRIGGVYGLVTQKYWEWMRVNLVFYTEDKPQSAQSALWRFSCSVDVKYASSAHEQSPQDTDPPYLADLLKFRDKLVEQIQQSLTKGHP